MANTSGSWWERLIDIQIIGCAVFGPVFLLLGIASFFTDISGLHLFGRPVEEAWQKAALATVGLTATSVSVGYLLLRRKQVSMSSAFYIFLAITAILGFAALAQ